ncbi:acetate kinase [bacterium]|nr:acetate kinase [bacterium]
MNVVVINCGSSSLKFQLIETSLEHISKDADVCKARGLVDRIGSQALISFQATGGISTKETAPIRDHKQAIDRAVSWFLNESKLLGSASDLGGVGHRVVHGGEHFQKSVRITPEVIDGIEDCMVLAPLHNPANLKGIRATQALLGSAVPQVAVFDTAFHATMPASAYLYGIPYNMYRRHKIRRYGFHGTSHRYVAYRYRQLLGLEKDQVNIISLHLGSGCSACAVKAGQSVDTSMGMTPLEGLLMGTRCGDLDPSVVEVLMQNEGLSVAEVDSLLNKQSGLLGISGLTGDMRDLLLERSENQDRRASLAIEIFCQRVRKYIGAYLAAMGGADAVVFTGGIGQNSPEIRAEIMSSFAWAGVDLDPQLNTNTVGETTASVSRPGSKLPVYVIPTNEELLIARDTVRAI